MEPPQDTDDKTSLIKLLLLVVIVGIVAFTGYYVATSVSNATDTLKQSASGNITQAKKTLPHTNIVFKVPELNVELVNVPKSLQDMVYAVNTGTPGVIRADFSTLALSRLDTHCLPTSGTADDGALSRFAGAYDAKHKPSDSVVFVKQFSGYWIGFTPETQKCSNDATTETLHDSQMSDFKALVTSSADIQSL